MLRFFPAGGDMRAVALPIRVSRAFSEITEDDFRAACFKAFAEAAKFLADVQNHASTCEPASSSSSKRQRC
jgi:hypothetical protein